MKLFLCYKALIDGSSTQIIDVYGNQYVMLDWNKLGKITWQGRPVVASSVPTRTVGPEKSAYYEETVNLPWGSQGIAGATFPLGNQFPRHDPRLTATKRRGLPPPQGPRPPNPRGHREAPKSHPPRDPIRRHEDEYMRRVRPSTLQKFVKKFDRSGDPHDHVA